MKKALLGLLALGAVSSAAADSVGGYLGTEAGVYYRNDRTATSGLRFSLNALNLFRGGTFSLGGEVAYLNDLSGVSLGSLNAYYGAGLGANVSLGANLGIGAYPHGLVGARYNVTGPISVFGEVNAGPTLNLSTGNTGLGFRLGARLGVDYQLR